MSQVSPTYGICFLTWSRTCEIRSSMIQSYLRWAIHKCASVMKWTTNIYNQIIIKNKIDIINNRELCLQSEINILENESYVDMFKSGWALRWKGTYLNVNCHIYIYIYIYFFLIYFHKHRNGDHGFLRAGGTSLFGNVPYTCV